MNDQKMPHSDDAYAASALANAFAASTARGRFVPPHESSTYAKAINASFPDRADALILEAYEIAVTDPRRGAFDKAARVIFQRESANAGT